MNARRVFYLVGLLLIGFSMTMALPLAWALYFGEWFSAASFAITLGLTASVGGLLRRRGGSEPEKVFRREALLVVACCWIAMPAFGAIPFLLEGVFQSPIDAYFEAVSGFTTTGATVLTEIETAMSRSLHFWRMQTHWLGGMGIMVLFVAILPSLGVGGKMLFKNEVPGPITEGLKPKIKETSAALWRIYITLTVVASLLLWLVGGLDLWEAIAHAMSTLGTGGFSTQNASVGGYDSVATDVIVMAFMFIAGANFSLYYAMSRGRVREALMDRELWLYVGITIVSAVVVTLVILPRHEGSILTAARYGIFQVLAIVTTTGFGTDDYDAYPALARNLLFFLMFVGGSTGSTAGGVKVLRFLVMFKAVGAYVHQTFRPQAVDEVKIAGSPVPRSAIRGITLFLFAYLSTFVIASVVMSSMMPDLETAASSVAACLGSVGPGLAGVGPTQNYAFIPAPGKLILAACMIMGRLELFTILVLFAPSFWRR